MLFIVTYSVAGSRCSGGYAVNAQSNEEACAIVEKMDSDYVKVVAMTQEEWGDDLGWDDLMEDVTVEAGKAESLYSGT